MPVENDDVHWVLFVNAFKKYFEIEDVKLNFDMVLGETTLNHICHCFRQFRSLITDCHLSAIIQLNDKAYVNLQSHRVHSHPYI